MGDMLIEIKWKANAIRSVNNDLLQVAYALSEVSSKRAFLVLVDSKITRKRLKEEWERISDILRPEIKSRLHICLFKDGTLSGVPQNPSRSDQEKIIEAVQAELDASGKFRVVRHTDRFYEVLRYLIHQWMMQTGPLSPTVIAEEIGCSYPTVSDAMGRLKRYLRRQSDRKIELKAFPRDEWARLVANAEKVRQTHYFGYTTQNKRTIDSQLKRFRTTREMNVAHGGVIGARFHFPDVDIVGTPRLDFTVNCQDRALNLDFVRRMDPALTRVSSDQHPSVVIHVINRKASRFSTVDHMVFYADPVECLLDLHEMRFEGQVEEIIRQLPFRNNNQHDDHEEESE